LFVFFCLSAKQLKYSSPFQLAAAEKGHTNIVRLLLEHEEPFQPSAGGMISIDERQPSEDKDRM
jgi:hypothetical protein